MAEQVKQRYVTLGYPPFSGPERDRAFLCGSPGFDPAKPFIVTLFFHGFDKPLDVQVAKHALPQQMAQVDENMVLVCPRIAIDRDNERNPGNFEDEAYFQQFLDELPGHIRALAGQGSVEAIAARLKEARFVVAAFSAGHGVASPILKFEAMRSKTICCLLFDSMYRRDSFFGYPEEVLKRGALVLVHTPDYDADSSDVADALRERIGERRGEARIFAALDDVAELGPDCAVIEAVSVPHWQSVLDDHRLAKALNKVSDTGLAVPGGAPHHDAVARGFAASAAPRAAALEQMRARVISETLNVRSKPSTSGKIVGTLSRGEVVAFAGSAPQAPRWAAITHEGQPAFVARRLVAQLPAQDVLLLDESVENLVTKVIRSAAHKYDDIAYRLGCKASAVGLGELRFSGTDIAGAPCSGRTVDCSGWVSGLFQLIAENVNHQAGRTVFSRQVVGSFSTHSDGQIAGIGQRTGQVWSGTDIDGLALRSGLLLGLNNADYDWEGEDRVFEIDHIVMCVRDGDGYAITQSSSGGGGVNTVPWQTWRSSMAARFEDFRVHCVDPFALGDWSAETRAVRAAARAARRELSPLEAAAG